MSTHDDGRGLGDFGDFAHAQTQGCSGSRTP